MQQPAAGNASADNSIPSGRSRLTQLIDRIGFGFLLLFAVALPHSIKGAERAWKIALILWMVKLAIDRARPFKQPLAAPLLAFVTLSAVSTLLSPEPYMSLDRMKFVCLILAGVVVAQNLKRLSQVRWLVALLVLSGFTAALYTGWQYTYGVGVCLAEVPADSKLAQAGFVANDVVTAVNGHRIHTPEDLRREVGQSPAGSRVAIEYIPVRSTGRAMRTASAEDFRESGMGTSALRFTRGRPYRAQGTLGHYVVFAEMLMQIGCMAWALMLAGQSRRWGWRLVFGVAFAGITAALLMTETRAAVAGLVIGCLLSLLLLGKGILRWAAVGALIVILAGATLWIQHRRGLSWVDRSDVGTQFRVLMWEDGIRLVREHPWFGVGMETVRVHFREWNIRAFLQYHVQSHFHSTYLQIAVERGIPALLAWLWFSIAYIVLLVRLIFRLRGQNRLACGIATGVLAGFMAFTFTSFLHYNLGEESLAMLLFFNFGVAVAMDRMLDTPGALDVA